MADDANQNPVDEDAPEASGEHEGAVEAEDPAAEVPVEPSDAGEPSDADEPKAEADEVPKAKAGAAGAQRTVTRRTVQSRRVTPKGGVAKPAPKGAPPVAESKARDAKKTESVIDRAEHVPLPPSAYAKGPSPWWVPALMFGLLILGALLIIANYAGAFGEPDNTFLVLGLGFILGGIITATQYR